MSHDLELCCLVLMESAVVRSTVLRELLRTCQVFYSSKSSPRLTHIITETGPHCSVSNCFWRVGCGGSAARNPKEIVWSWKFFTVILHSSDRCQHSPPCLWEILRSDWNNKQVYFSPENLNYDYSLSFALGVLGVQTRLVHIGQARAVTLNHVPSLDSEHSYFIGTLIFSIFFPFGFGYRSSLKWTRDTKCAHASA